MKFGFHWQWVAVGAACLGCSGGGSSNGKIGDGPGGMAWQPYPGFERITELGENCAASVAADPTEDYGALKWIPCASGEAGCEELKFDGALHWDPTGSGDMLEFHGRFARDASGHLTKLLLQHRYPRGIGYQGIPFEAVVYDVASGKPVAAFRNPGDREPPPSQDGTIHGGFTPSCEIELAASNDAIWVIGVSSGTKKVFAGTAAFGDGVPELRPIDASAAAIEGRVDASNAFLAFEDTDGAIFRVGADPALDGPAYGPAVRVWLEAVIGNDVLAFNDQNGPDTKLYRMNGAGSFDEIPSRGSLIRADGMRFAWLESPTGFGAVPTVWSRDTGAGLEEAVQGPAVPDAVDADEATLADGAYALLSRGKVTLVDLATGAVKSRDTNKRPILTGDHLLVANDASHVYLTEPQGSEVSKVYRYTL